MTNNDIHYFRIIETAETAAGQIHTIDWNYYLPKKFYKALGKHVIQLGWMKSGQYAIIRTEKATQIKVSHNIINDFKQIIAFLLRNYSL